MYLTEDVIGFKFCLMRCKQPNFPFASIKKTPGPIAALGTTSLQPSRSQKVSALQKLLLQHAKLMTINVHCNFAR